MSVNDAGPLDGSMGGGLAYSVNPTYSTRVTSPIPMTMGIVWPAEEILLMPTMPFQWIMSSVAVLTVTTTVTLATDCNF